VRLPAVVVLAFVVASTVASAADEAATAIPTSRIQGSAIFERNRPIAGATVVVRSESGDGRFVLTSTDARGKFQVDGLPEGSYGVAFVRDGLQPVIKTGIELKPPFRGVVEVIMRPGTAGPPPAAPSGAPVRLRGSALDTDGKPLPDVKIRFVRADGQTEPREALTDGTGTFDLEGLPSGRWEIESLGLAFLPLRAEIPLEGETSVRLVLVRQPATYKPLPLDLIPPEEPIPPGV
jgi:hypothetical protein